MLCVEFSSFPAAEFSSYAGSIRLEVANRGSRKIQHHLPSVPKSLNLSETLPPDLRGEVGRPQLLTSLSRFRSFLSSLLPSIPHRPPPICPYGGSNMKLVTTDGNYECSEFIGENIFVHVHIHIFS